MRLKLLGCGLLAVLALPLGGVAQEPPQTPVAPHSVDLTAFRAAALAAKGDAERGRRLVENDERTRCLACHAIAGKGASLGPDLAGQAGRSDAAEILDSILEPSAKIHPDYASTTVVLRSGQVLQGIVQPLGETELDIATSATDKVRVARGEIDEQSPCRVSLMPGNLHELLSAGEVADIVAYLTKLEPARSNDLKEALSPRDIPRATSPATFRPIIDASAAFQHPVWLVDVPGHTGKLAVVELRGQVWLLEADGSRRSLFVDLTDEVIAGDFTGLTSLAFHPDFAHNRRYFLKQHARVDGRLVVQVVERRASDNGLSDSGQPSKVVFTIPIFSDIHNGGHLAFGLDGFLYVGMGDTGPQEDPRGHGQDLSVLFGKLSRIDIDRTEQGRVYAIPADNPFRDVPNACPEIWALGFRAPWRFSFDPATGDLWVGDVGQGLYEEVAIVRRGENHGWNVLEGFRPFSDQHRKPGAKFTPPLFAYHHRVGVSVTGGFVYRGVKTPAFDGRYICGDFETRRVWALEQQNGRLKSIIEIGLAPDRIVSFGQDDAGEIYLIGYDRGLIYHVDLSTVDLTPLPAAGD
jgi:putative heme-binding domain-containing protein